jgi:hypothetical protein
MNAHDDTMACVLFEAVVFENRVRWYRPG